MGKDQDANKGIIIAAISTATAGFLDPTPGGFDCPFMVGVWATMLVGLGVHYNIDVNKKALVNTLTSALGCSALYIGGAKLFATALKYTGLGTIAGCIVNAVLNGVFTCRVGGIYKNCWSKGDKWPTAKEIADALINIVSFTAIGEIVRTTRSVARGKCWTDSKDRNKIFECLFAKFID